MSSSFSRGSMPRIPVPPVTSFHYRETPGPMPSLPRIKPSSEPEPKRAEVEMTELDFEASLAQARGDGAAAARTQLETQHREQLQAQADRITDALSRFEQERRDYFTRVESEVVRLALSIAGKILHREAQVDPMLVAALVQIAVNQLNEGTSVSVRVDPESAERWRTHFSTLPQSTTVTVIEDAELEPGGCLLETELGAADFSLSAQLKEVEQGFFDVLAQTPRA